MIHEVKLPIGDGTVSTELQCDIQPGALRQRYYVNWSAVFSNRSTTYVSNSFNLTLNVSSSTNGSHFQCHVAIDHDGSGIPVIYGGRHVLVIVTQGT